MPADLLFELGCEEIPAKMLARALADLPAAVTAKLATARLSHGRVRALGTPRRLALIVEGLADRQPDLDEEVVGPPVSAAFAADGTLTKAGQGFAAKNGVAESALAKKEVAGKKGLYVVASRHVAGEETRKLLPDILRGLASGIAWPKSMRWGWNEFAFVRPVQWLVALYGGEVVPFEWAGQTAGRKSRGHRFLAPGSHEISDAAAYVEALRAAHVEVDQDQRRTRVQQELARIEKDTGARARPDEALLDEVMHLGEWPVGVSGQFDPAYLRVDVGTAAKPHVVDVPEEMIVTAMRTHQRYFAMNDNSDKLTNRFVTMAATIVKDPAVVARGNEKVLAARLSDAKYFFATDCKASLDAWNASLDGVVFQAKLGDKAKTIGDKVRRLVRIVEAVSGSIGAVQIAKYCKADLASKAVGEFPELQGVMGKHYARYHGLDETIAVGIEQHWWPKGQGGELPKSDLAAYVSLADKMDTIVGCFAVGLEPTGSADPFGLRRAAIGIWQILLDRRWPDKFAQLLARTRETLEDSGVKLKDAAKLDEFFRARLRGIFVDQGIPGQDVDAALAQGYSDPSDAHARALACAKISKEARDVFKRVANILDDARKKGIAINATVSPDLFTAQVERDVYSAVRDAQEREKQFLSKKDYRAVFESLEQLRPVVAAFFDKGGVMVMDPDPKLRDNRLGLLEFLILQYMQIVDLRKLVVA